MTLIHGAGVRAPSSRTVTYSRPSVGEAAIAVARTRARGRARACVRVGSRARESRRAGRVARIASPSTLELLRQAAAPARSTARAAPEQRRASAPALSRRAARTRRRAGTRRIGARSLVARHDRRAATPGAPADKRRPLVQDHDIDREAACMRQYSWARTSWRARSRSLGRRRCAPARSADRPRSRAPRASRRPARAAALPERTRAAPARRRARCRRAAGRAAPRRARCPGGGAGPARCVHASVAARSNAVASRCLSSERRAARRASARPASRTRARTVRPARHADAAAQAEDRIEHRADRVRERPAVDRSRSALRDPRPRPMKRARSVSNCSGRPRSRPRRPRVRRPDRPVLRRPRAPACASSAPSSATYSVCTNSFENARCAASAVARREHDLGVRGDLDLARCAPRLESETRRTSASSSGETTTSIVVVERSVAPHESRRGPPRSRPRSESGSTPVGW